MKPALRSCSILLISLAFSRPQALQPPCDVGINTLIVSSTAQALDLTAALLCSGGGQFEVTWLGEVLITSTITVSEGISLKVTGSSFIGQGVVDGGGDIRCGLCDCCTHVRYIS